MYYRSFSSKGGTNKMFRQMTLPSRRLEKFNYEDTKRNVSSYFESLADLEWELARLNAGQGISRVHDYSTEHRKQPYNPIGKDIFNICAKECKENELKQYISDFYWAKSFLSDAEQLYLMEYFINRKYEDEIIDLLGFNSSDSREYKRLKRSAVYKFADFLNLIAEKN